jgi:hypothetical protein
VSRGGKKGKEKEPIPATEEPVKIYLHFKRYVYDINKKMVQT